MLRKVKCFRLVQGVKPPPSLPDASPSLPRLLSSPSFARSSVLARPAPSGCRFAPLPRVRSVCAPSSLPALARLACLASLRPVSGSGFAQAVLTLYEMVASLPFLVSLRSFLMVASLPFLVSLRHFKICYKTYFNPL